MSSPSPGKRRMDTDVVKLIESNHEVTILGGLNEFFVKFFGPKGIPPSSDPIRTMYPLVKILYIISPYIHTALPFLPDDTCGYIMTYSPYEGGVWKVRVDLPDKYPFKSPSIGFVNKIFHPNIDEASGTVCLDVINQAWTALYDLNNVFESFLPQLLSYPNPIDPLNGDAAALYLHKPEDYKAKIKDYVRRYASAEAMNERECNMSSSSESSLSDFSEDEAQDMEL